MLFVELLQPPGQAAAGGGIETVGWVEVGGLLHPPGQVVTGGGIETGG